MRCGNQNKMDNTKTDDARKHIPWQYCNRRGRFVSGNCHNLCHWTVSSEDSCTRCTNWVVGVEIFFVHTTVLSLKTAFNLVKIHLLFRIMILIQWNVNISVFVNHVVIVFWGPNEGDRKRTYIPVCFPNICWHSGWIPNENMCNKLNS